jgi:hypothetical protein
MQRADGGWGFLHSTVEIRHKVASAGKDNQVSRACLKLLPFIRPMVLASKPVRPQIQRADGGWDHAFDSPELPAIEKHNYSSNIFRYMSLSVSSMTASRYR